MDFVWLIWFLVGFIIGMFSLLFVFVCYEEHRTLKFEKFTPITDEQDKELREQEQRIKSIKFPNKKRR